MEWDKKILARLLINGSAETLEQSAAILDKSFYLKVWPCPPGVFECCLFAKMYKTLAGAGLDPERAATLADGALVLHRFNELENHGQTLLWAMGDVALSPGAHWRNVGTW